MEFDPKKNLSDALADKKSQQDTEPRDNPFGFIEEQIEVARSRGQEDRVEFFKGFIQRMQKKDNVSAENS